MRGGEVGWEPVGYGTFVVTTSETPINQAAGASGAKVTQDVLGTQDMNPEGRSLNSEGRPLNLQRIETAGAMPKRLIWGSRGPGVTCSVLRTTCARGTIIGVPEDVASQPNLARQRPTARQGNITDYVHVYLCMFALLYAVHDSRVTTYHTYMFDTRLASLGKYSR
jgi:hypothetical protein